MEDSSPASSTGRLGIEYEAGCFCAGMTRKLNRLNCNATGWRWPVDF